MIFNSEKLRLYFGDDYLYDIFGHTTTKQIGISEWILQFIQIILIYKTSALEEIHLKD